MRNLILVLGLMSVTAFAAPKSASAYYSDAAFQYIQNRLPTAEITCNEGLGYYPNDQKLQMLLDRIREAKDQQKNENKKNDPQNNQDKNKENQDQNNQDDQNQDKDNQSQDNQQNQDGNSSSSGEGQNQDQTQDQGEQSSDSNGQSSDSQGENAPEPQPEQPENSSDSQGEEEQTQEVPLGQMSAEEASQLLKDFDEQNGERKPWKPIRGQARPLKDW
ncbi:MAG: hypothetical protein HUK21_05855 [Fibrobacteraceae bacterium]|nr:hypothetical protein [Fibrobacteraceae bacterium]